MERVGKFEHGSGGSNPSSPMAGTPLSSRQISAANKLINLAHYILFSGELTYSGYDKGQEIQPGIKPNSEHNR